ncbi:MAG: hypothetical protein Q4C95_12895 [Planctomycetia bacterium]|nr:hypothetical protein [Planctomycetia bacterium]
MSHTFSSAFSKIMDRASAGEILNRTELISLLQYPEISPEADRIRTLASQISRERFQNRGVILGQIGYETAPCPGNCQFCAFARDYTTLPEKYQTAEEIRIVAADFLAHQSLFALFLMGMHDFKFDHLLDIINTLSEVLRSDIKLVVNIGDFTRSQANELRAAGVSGAYHVLRLGEGEVTQLEPVRRRETIQILREAGLEWYYCCEPIGPEHTPEELVDQILLGREFNAFQHAAMRRVLLPNSPLARHGVITELRLAQITAVVALAMIGNDELRSIAVHEPNPLGLCSGANAVYAEIGSNPRDLTGQTEKSRGHSVVDCETMLRECGYPVANNGNFSPVPLCQNGLR